MNGIISLYPSCGKNMFKRFYFYIWIIIFKPDSRTLLRLGVLKKTYNFSIIPKQFLIDFMPLAVQTAKFREWAHSGYIVLLDILFLRGLERLACGLPYYLRHCNLDHINSYSRLHNLSILLFQIKIKINCLKICKS